MLPLFEKLSHNLNLLMAEARVNANELARRTGIPASSIKKIRNNNNANPTLSTLMPIAKHFGITVSQLIGDEMLPTQLLAARAGSQHTIPLITWGAATHWPQTTAEPINYIATERAYSDTTFGLIIEEDCGGIFLKGTVLIIDSTIAPQQQDYVITEKELQLIPSIKQIVVEDGETFLKSILMDQHIILKTDEYRVLGVVMEYRNYFRGL